MASTVYEREISGGATDIFSLYLRSLKALLHCPLFRVTRLATTSCRRQCKKYNRVLPLQRLSQLFFSAFHSVTPPFDNLPRNFHHVATDCTCVHLHQSFAVNVARQVAQNVAHYLNRGYTHEFRQGPDSRRSCPTLRIQSSKLIYAINFVRITVQ